jgi:tRNA threonylcarbamoyladenosine biosynthesis protein TsaB
LTKILAIDTSTSLGAVALFEDAHLISETAVHVKRGHAGYLLPIIENLLKNAGLQADQLDLVACAIGPGSFSALRVGISTAKGLAFGAGAQVTGINTLEAMAHSFGYANKPVLPVLDAKKDQVYAAFFEPTGAGACKRAGEDLVLAPEELIEQIKPGTIVFGEGVTRYESLFREKLKDSVLFIPEHFCYHRGGAVADLGWGRYLKEDVDQQLLPHYLRPPDAAKPKNASIRRANDSRR